MKIHDISIMNPTIYDINESGKFYVYELWNPIINLPFYVGKGKNNRYLHHFNHKSIKNNSHKSNTILSIFNQGYKVLVKIILKTDDELIAFNKEIELITKYGRKDNNTGILTNKTNGGEGTAGYIPTLELRKLWSINRKKEGNGMYGKNHTKESIKKLSETRKARFKSGQIIPTKHSKEWINYLCNNNPAAKNVDTDLIIKLHSKGYSNAEISRQSNISLTIIDNRLKKYNLKNNFEKTKNINMNNVFQMQNININNKDIAQKLKISYSTLMRKIKLYNGK